jgi:hypothetical protein
MDDEPTQFLHADGDKYHAFLQTAVDRLVLFALSEAASIRISSKRVQDREQG